MSVKLAAGAAKMQTVQTLRGLAALLVLIFHCSLNSNEYFKVFPSLNFIWQNGWMGVEFFFVLSGFIITYVHLKDMEANSGAAHFLRKRFLRIYPIYWVVATIMLAYYLFFKNDNHGIKVSVNSPADILYLLKCYFLYPMNASRKNFIDVAWTLSYEVWFYIVFAFSILMGLRKAYFLYFSWMILILFKRYTHIGDSIPTLNFILNPIILYFLSGCLIAYLLRKNNLRFRLWQFAGLIGLAFGFLIAYAKLSGSLLDQTRSDINYYYLLILLFGFILAAAAVVDARQKIKDRPRLFVLIGDASYSLYLIHPAVVMLCYKISTYLGVRFGISTSRLAVDIVFIGTVLVSTITGILLHLFIEKPLLKFLKSRFRVRHQPSLSHIQPTHQ